MKIVVDTNVLISAFLTEGTSKDVLDVVLSKGFCVLSGYILEEFRETLGSKKFDHPKAVIEGFVGYLSKYSTLTDEDPKIQVKCPDPDDQKILALCQTVNADLLITGDAQLLAMERTGATLIIRPNQFWEAITKIQKS